MRKLGITIAALAAVLFGLVGFAPSPAGAQTEVCDGLQSASEGAATHPFAEQDPSVPPGEPVTSAAAGAAESCTQSFAEQAPVLGPLLCGVAQGIDNRATSFDQDASGLTGQIRGLVEEGCGGGGNGGCTSNCGNNNNNNNGGGGTDDEVLANNAAADGGLPRTGGELFAGAGLGLMSLGAIARRFIR